jgi:hypothetical protein
LTSVSPLRSVVERRDVTIPASVMKVDIVDGERVVGCGVWVIGVVEVERRREV